MGEVLPMYLATGGNISKCHHIDEVVFLIKKNPGHRGVSASLEVGVEDGVLLVELCCRVLGLKGQSSRSSGYL